MLTVDVGNSSVVVARWRGDEPELTRFAEPEQAAATLDGPAVGIGVSRRRLERLEAALPSGQPWRRLEGCPLPVADPRLAVGTGADRLAAALAAAPGPAVVVDAGTALTVDLVDGGVFLGGFIAAGPAAVLEGLSRLGEALPPVEARAVPLEPAVETVGALRAGAWAQALGAADRLVAAALERLPGARVLCAGGWGRAWVEAGAPVAVQVDEALVHRGLRRWADGA